MGLDVDEEKKKEKEGRCKEVTEGCRSLEPVQSMIEGAGRGGSLQKGSRVIGCLLALSIRRDATQRSPALHADPPRPRRTGQPGFFEQLQLASIRLDIE